MPCSGAQTSLVMGVALLSRKILSPVGAYTVAKSARPVNFASGLKCLSRSGQQICANSISRLLDLLLDGLGTILNANGDRLISGCGTSSHHLQLSDKHSPR